MQEYIVYYRVGFKEANQHEELIIEAENERAAHSEFTRFIMNLKLNPFYTNLVAKVTSIVPLREEI